MGEARADLTAALGGIIGVPCTRSLATNSLKLVFATREQARCYIWIDPPWRMTLDGVLVSGSADWPVWDGVRDREINQPLWEAWCALFDPLNRTVVADVAVGEQLPDLRLRFASGHIIETFGNGAAGGYWWYYFNRNTGEVFEAGPTGIIHAFGKPAEA